MQFHGLLESDASTQPQRDPQSGEPGSTAPVPEDGPAPRMRRIIAWAAVVTLLVGAFAAAFWAAGHVGLLPDSVTGRAPVSRPPVSPER